jgi:hypothetical protein
VVNLILSTIELGSGGIRMTIAETNSDQTEIVTVLEQQRADIETMKSVTSSGKIDSAIEKILATKLQEFSYRSFSQSN